MTQRIQLLVVVGVILAFAAVVSAYTGPFSLLMPSPGEVVKIIDALTKSDSATAVDVKVGRTVSQGKLLVARTRIDVELERSSRNWRGRVQVQMIVPSEITYSIDLSQIKHLSKDHEDAFARDMLVHVLAEAHA